MDAPAPVQKTRPPHYDYIDAVRAFAILGVLAIHVGLTVDHLGPTLSRLVPFGNFGVQLFFVASALTLAISHEARHGRDRRPLAAFFTRRLFRIVPLFWTGIAFYLWWYGFGPRPAAPDGISGADIVVTALFAHGWRPDQINAVVPGGWSIAVEWSFYLVTPFLLAVARTPARGVCVLFGCVLIAVASRALTVPELLFPNETEFCRVSFASYWFPAQVPIFALGILAYHLIRGPRSERAVILGGLMACAAIGQFTAASPILLPGVVFVLVAWGLSSYPAPLLVNRITRYLGRVSYSCYLTHFVILDCVRELMGLSLAVHQPNRATDWIRQPLVSIGTLPGTLQFAILFCMTVAATVLLSTVTYYLIERPGVRAGQWVIRRFHW